MAANSLEDDAKKYGWFEEGLNVERRVDRQKLIEEMIQTTDAELAGYFQERKPLAKRSGAVYSELVKKGYKQEYLEWVKELREVPTIDDDALMDWIYLNRHIKDIDRQIVLECEERKNLSEEDGRIVGELVEVSESSPLNLQKLLTRIGMAEEELLCFNKHIGELEQKVNGQGLIVKSDRDMLDSLIGERALLEEMLSLYKSDLHYLQNPAAEEEEEEPMSPSRQEKLDRFGTVVFELQEIRKEI
ncbi:unnamed protein product [Linum trigynum]|uniref:Uncharacterized protein n=1 Tax=Linum trigynum TaxID=586398 RepID=A0AAV2EYB2_9ROSI